MQFHDLKSTWRKEMDLVNKKENYSFNDLKRKVSKLDHQILFRDVIETLVAVFIITALAIHWILNDNLVWLLQLGMLVMSSTCVLIIYRLYQSRKFSSKDEWTLSNRLVVEINKLEQQAVLFNSITSWYIIPVFLSILLSSLGGYYQRTGSYIPDLSLWLYYATCIALAGAIYWFNRRAAIKRVTPLLTQLKKLQSELND